MADESFDADVGGARVRRDLERGLNPLVSVLPRYLFAAVLPAQFVAAVAGLPALRDIARGVLALAVLVGVVALTVLLVDYTIAPAGSMSHRLRGLASAWTSALVVGFTFAWYLEAEGARPGVVFLVEVVSFAAAVLCSRDALRLTQHAGDSDAPAAIDASEFSAWPFRPAR
jgi:hypothetical protein